jgi:4-diphosphocytidyl-2-C-methyl-D-erythritol kinase
VPPRGLRTLAPGKVNLCLFVGEPRPEDGLHPLVSVVQPVSLADVLTLEPDPEGAAAGAHDRVHCPGVAGENLAARALAGFRAATGWDAPPQRLRIDKRVPLAAGMGGGSADAAAALRLAAAASGLPVPEGLAMRLGADVPVLLDPTRALMTGAGERVEPLPAAPAFGLVVAPVDAELSTPAVYRACDLLGLARSADDLAALEGAVRAAAAGGAALPAELAVNDLQDAARHLCPAIDGMLAAVRAAGAEHALVSGSGPTVVGLCSDAAGAERVAAALRAAGYPRAVAVAAAAPDAAAVVPA